MKSSAYPSTQSAAYALHEWITDNHLVAQRLTARPWNHYEPLNTDWWLIPSTEWPAYRHAKVFFRARDANRVLYTGFYLEKGLSPRVAEAYPTGKKLVMQENWAWHTFFDALAREDVTLAITSIFAQSGLPVRIELHAHLVEDPGSYDPYAPPMDQSWAAFDTQDGSLRLVDSVQQGRMFEQVVASQAIPDLVEALAHLPNSDWTWVNLNLGVRLKMAPLVPGRESVPMDTWNATIIWERCLLPWKPWIV
jgi:hypothetical protein